MKSSRKVTIITFASIALISQPLASWAVVTVDPGNKISAGKTIIGSGQNLPTLNSRQPWNNGSQAKDQVMAYYSNGSVALDRRDLVNSATTWTRMWLKEACGSVKPVEVRNCKAAAVFDIDDTLLSSYNVASTNTPAFSYNPERSKIAESTCQLPPIKATRKLLKDFQSWGLDIFLITGRSESERSATIECLNAAGISGWRNLVMRQEDDKALASVYKANARKAIENTGGKIGPSIGDQVSDMSYGHLGRGFLMPNLTYFIP
jgi:predicted secreted acid phosphatase